MLLLLFAPPALLAPEPAMPPWWNQWARMAAFSSSFVQEGESAAFGKLTESGTILMASGGRLRVEYKKGILLVSDGQQLWQYDPSTRTAQNHNLESVSEEWPMLRLLTDPAALNQVFHVNPQSDGKVKLIPKKAGRADMPEVILEGKGGFLHRATWKDGTGATQVLTLTDTKTRSDPGKKPFTFNLPPGARAIQL